MPFGPLAIKRLVFPPVICAVVIATLQAHSPSRDMDMSFDWHAGPITRATPLDRNYRNTQQVRQFLVRECGEGFRFDRAFMAWIKSGTAASMGEVADEWLRRHG